MSGAPPIVVQKYGGTSLATNDRIRAVARLIGDTYRSARPIVVVSAMGSTTDDLVRLAHALSPSPADRELDQLLATGESAAAALLAMTLHEIGIPAVSLTGGQAGIGTSDTHGSGLIRTINTERIARLMRAGAVGVVAGFQGVNKENDVVTLGRGGSDTTAVALAVELNAARCEIYTDVPGVYTADPKVVASARPIPAINVDVMAELARSGAKVLHPRSVELAAVHGLDLHVLSSFERLAGTVISSAGRTALGTVVAVTHDHGSATVSLVGSGLLDRPEHTARMLATLAAVGIPVVSSSRSERRASVTVPPGRVTGAVRALHRAFALGGPQAGFDRQQHQERTSRAA